MFIHMQMAKEKQNLLLVTFERKVDKARFECYLLNCTLTAQIDYIYLKLSQLFAPDNIMLQPPD